MSGGFAREYPRAAALLAGCYRRLLAAYEQPDAETRAALTEARVAIVLLGGLRALHGLPDLPPRHKGEPEPEGEGGGDGARRARRRETDATKW